MHAHVEKRTEAERRTSCTVNGSFYSAKLIPLLILSVVPQHLQQQMEWRSRWCPLWDVRDSLDLDVDRYVQQCITLDQGK